MTKTELQRELKRIETAYGDKFQMTQERFDLWYELVAQYDAALYHEAVTQYMRESDFAPLPGSIYKKYAEIKEKSDSADRDVRQEWRNAVSEYEIHGGKVMDGDYEIFFETIIRKIPISERWKAASKFFGTVSKYADEHDGQDLPPFSEFIRGLP